MGSILDKLKKDEEAANSLLEGLNNPASSVTSAPVVSAVASGVSASAPSQVVDSVASSVVSSVPSSVTGSVASSVVGAPVVSSLDDLETIIKGLKLQLEDENSPTAKQRHATLQGMFNKLNDEIKELKANTLKEPEPKKLPAASEVHKEILSKMQADYGDNVTAFIGDLIDERIKKSLGSEVSGKLKEQSDRIDVVENYTGRTAGEIFIANITARVPNWKQINGWSTEGIPQDPRYTVFMKERAPGTGKTYTELLNESWNVHDVSAAGEIFDIFNARIKPAEAPPAGAANINDHIDPDNNAGGGGAPDTDPKKKTYTQVEVDDFYNSIGKGKFDGTIEEREALDNEYSTALIEGRVL